MTTAEWVAVCNRVIDLWGNLEVWTTAKHAAYSQARRFDQTTLYGVVDDAFAAGTRFPPSPSQMLRTARERQRFEVPALGASSVEVEAVRLKLLDGWHTWKPGPDGCTTCGVEFEDHT